MNNTQPSADGTPAYPISEHFKFGELTLSCPEPAGWDIRLVRETATDGAEIARISLFAEKETPPPRFMVSLAVPQVGMHYLWQPYAQDFFLPPDWAEWSARWKTDLAHGLPVYAGFDLNDVCHFSVAASECFRAVTAVSGLREEGSMFVLSLEYFADPEAPIDRYETFMRIDSRPTALPDAIRSASAWIDAAGGYVPCKVPGAAFEPLYSTWYNFHKDVFAKDIEEELQIAAGLGMKTAILDDGWHTDDITRDYARCGDWRVSQRRFPDMREHVRRVHELGMKYMVWYSVAFVGRKSAAAERFAGKSLYLRKGIDAYVIDPRFPEARRFLVETFSNAVRDFGLDGLKLDFIDSFRFEGPDPAIADNYAGRDVKSLPLAVDMLMKEVRAALEAINPDILVEFRQSYIGAAIRQYGNMLRVGDCPGDMRRNRVAIAILRLTSGETAVHADMLEWSINASAEEAALHVLNCIFGVVQYSVMLRYAPESHLRMLRHWIAFSTAHRNALLNGSFTPHHAELMFPLIEAGNEDERIVGVYDDARVADCGNLAKTTYILNATGGETLFVKCAEGVEGEAFDTFGEPAGRFTAGPGVAEVKCPRGGYVRLEPVPAPRLCQSKP